jgi:predicted fused transcriptional regulator/phosphomethylpyrimidine kinase
LKLNGTHQLLVYADDVNILVGSIHTIWKNTEALVIVSKETGLEVHTDKTKYMVMSRDQNVRQNCNIKISNKSFAAVE